ncbi:unnamed protein product [Closterium sp. NIES-54]
MTAAKRVLRYLCSTSGMGLVLGGQSPVVLTGHADASWVDDQATQRSSQGYTFSLGSGSVSWRATRSSSVLGSSCEAEIYAGAMAAQELRWLTYLLTDLGEPPRSPPVLYVDNKAMLALCREQRLEHRTKHIALRYFLARELQQRGQLRLAYVASEANTADVFTKALALCDHQRFYTQLGSGGGENKEKWREAMDKELKALQERNTWKVVPIGVARNKTILTGKWVFRVKTKADGTIDNRHTSLRILLAVAAMKKKKLRQIDVANAFLYAPVNAEIYVELPHGSHGEPNQVCQLQKSLYGIKQAPRLWQQYLHARLIRIVFKQLPHDQGMYRLSKDNDYILLIVYVDDLLYIGSTDSVTTWFEGELEKDLTLTVSSTVTQYLGLNIQEGEDVIYLNAAKYADTIAKRFALTPTTISTPYCYTAGNNKIESAPMKPAGIRNYQRKL